jgi:hypothetical protein
MAAADEPARVGEAEKESEKAAREFASRWTLKCGRSHRSERQEQAVEPVKMVWAWARR